MVLKFQHDGRLKGEPEYTDVLKNPNPAIP
jgi:hypothetical protein